MHALVEVLDVGPVDLFGSSGGAVTALALGAAHPGDVATLVAHEPPLIGVLPDAAEGHRARVQVREISPAAFGMPTGDDGTRDDPLLADRSWAVSR